MVELHLRTIIDAPIERCFDLSRSIEVHLLGTERNGEQAVAGVTSGLIGMGEFVRWDRFAFAAPLLVLGPIAERLVLRRYMTSLLAHRNEVLKEVAESDWWRTLLPEDAE